MPQASSKESYIEGRLMGLHDLIDVLKDAVETEEKVEMTAVVKSLVTHISNEMDEIIKEMHTLHEQKGMEPPEELENAKEQAAKLRTAAPRLDQAPEKAPQEFKKNVDAADDLMKNLMEIRKRTGAVE